MNRNLIGALLATSLLCVAGAGAGDDWIELLPEGDLAAWREPTGDWRTAHQHPRSVGRRSRSC